VLGGIDAFFCQTYSVRSGYALTLLAMTRFQSLAAQVTGKVVTRNDVARRITNVAVLTFVHVWIFHFSFQFGYFLSPRPFTLGAPPKKELLLFRTFISAR